MSLFSPLAYLLAYDPTTNPLNNNEWSFPLLEILHILGFALSIGTIAVVDLRLLGWGMKQSTPSQLLKATAPWSLAGLVVMLTTGPAIFSSDPRMYLFNQGFRFKMFVLLAAIVYNYTTRRWAALSGASGGAATLIGGWVLLAFGVLAWFSDWSFAGGLAMTIAGLLSFLFWLAFRGRKEESWESGAALIGGVSLALWVSVVAGGIFIAFV
ncbi:MAG: hypothetical protein JO307_28210 [Bryobacterales bacterium]|nr:hypothetical protein [Bryobacterales bacterium]MBV9402032.1 hypothetical protein [Bryobacterales bacterium]